VPIWIHEGLAKYLESRWRGPYGGAMTPSTLALLGSRVRKNNLVPFEKMHPSMALLPTAEDAATAFAEVYFAVDLLYQRENTAGLKKLLGLMAQGETDQHAVEAVFGAPFPAFEKAWLAHVKKQPFPKELIPISLKDRKELAEGDKDKKGKKDKDVSFGDFKEVEELDARRWAHLGELMRERNRPKAAAEHFSLAWQQVKDRYESVSNKYALTLLELKRFDEAEGVLRGSLKMHPGSGPTSVHLGRILLRKADYPKAKEAYLDALAVNPFDPEVHLALYRCADALKDDALRTRAKAALLTLEPKVQPQMVAALAAAFARDDDLSDVKIGAEPKSVIDAGDQLPVGN
jgi:tetratricopeptide (TPR) repeat protein